MPFKLHAEHRHHISKPGCRCTNWPAYNPALRRRGSRTVWLTDEAIAAWRMDPRTTPGGQPDYSALAIMTVLTMHTVFGLASRRTVGLIGSVTDRFGLAFAVPDYATLCRRNKMPDVLAHRRVGTGPLLDQITDPLASITADAWVRTPELCPDRVNPDRIGFTASVPLFRATRSQ